MEHSTTEKGQLAAAFKEATVVIQNGTLLLLALENGLFINVAELTWRLPSHRGMLDAKLVQDQMNWQLGVKKPRLCLNATPHEADLTGEPAISP